MTIPIPDTQPHGTDRSSADAEADGREMTRIAVIGAGAAGLAQVKQLLDAFDRDDVKGTRKLEVVCFEKGEQVGGVWYIDEEKSRGQTKPYKSTILQSKSGYDQPVIYPGEGPEPSPMYDNLRTNLPHDIMAYRDLPAPSSDPLAPAPETSIPSAPSTKTTPKLPPFSSLYPKRAEMQTYLETYASWYGLYKHIRLQTVVTRVYKRESSWIVHTRPLEGGEEEVEEFDMVSCANGHYSDAWLPELDGLSTFPGQILHSRYFTSPAPFAGKTILVVGSFASGGDIARLMALWNAELFEVDGSPKSRPVTNGHHANGNTSVSNGNSDTAPEGPVRIHVSCSGLSPYSTPTDDPDQPWGKWFTYHPLISRVEGSTVHFQPGPEGSDTTHKGETELKADVILFATGYTFSLPFCKRTDAPWDGQVGEVLDGQVESEERRGGAEWEVGGIKGLGMKVGQLDELLLFLKGDRSLALPGLPYQVVPFPLVEAQARLTSLLWSGSLTLPPSKYLILPPNPSNPYSSISSSASEPKEVEADERNGLAQQNSSSGTTPVRGAFAKRQQLVFNAPYEWDYEDHILKLMAPAGSGKQGVDVEDKWKAVEGWRRDRRADKGLRKRILGF